MNERTASETVEAVLFAAQAIDWSRVRHLRGAATDIPPLLRGLASDADDTRRHALRTLGARILPFYDGIDGAVCEATSFVVPFLVRLAAANVPDAAELLVLLRRIASVAWDRDPYPENAAAHGASGAALAIVRRVVAQKEPPAPTRNSLARIGATMGDASRALFRHFDPVAAELLYGYRVHVALNASLPEIFALLAHDEGAVRIEAARLVERLAQSAARPPDLSLRLVAHLDTEREETVIAHLVLALGHVGDRHARTLLEALLDARDPLVRVIAAVSLAPAPTEASLPRRLTVLVEALAAGESALAERYATAASRPLIDDAASALTSCERDMQAVGALLLGVLADSRDREVPEAVLDVLVEVMFPNAAEPITATALTKDQRTVLRRISTERAKSRDRDIAAKLAAKGLPTDPRTLARFVALN